MEPGRLAQFLNFLQEDLAIPTTDLQLALRHPEQTPNLLPIILWQYGLVTLNQLDRIFDWLQGNV
ncbi:MULTISPECIES: DUF2949 domain-containing protein [Fischerella]|mgnify:CR=1 FL=1|jgi:hypothetical protein|uniref:DUF2949 domain-containing protein n=5 Tax=Fischerella TaxID=1190 RepID=G6FRV4_9CYAN|nr:MULTISPECIES: DUF2949 domain-containing protein [Fischerella]PLZ94851.1 DUF2949 domain-containing protein [Fischerella thermalis CCMEE 5196]PMB01068.1 DUF2949 domain-containing protein [Fischerella thermalis CCMEE 5328]PMB07340.1 DUF2949 domain-containing protein [Fischerella thermalis CCMEE 5273]PMB18459.1 DUF2949 domain-containing protein [Fischerella thermalis CCMEE 5319]PMB43281.1 DUF2949 domain-containing protein [Fischerella thermalis CCMEE 5205]PMB50043.1 DUF2949 domain-containing p